MARDLIRESELTDEQLDELLEHQVVMIDGHTYVPYGTDAANVPWLIGTHVEWYRPRADQPAREHLGELPKIHGVPDTQDYLRPNGGADVEIEA